MSTANHQHEYDIVCEEAERRGVPFLQCLKDLEAVASSGAPMERNLRYAYLITKADMELAFSID